MASPTANHFWARGNVSQDLLRIFQVICPASSYAVSGDRMVSAGSVDMKYCTVTDDEIKDADVLLVEDIVDTGESIEHMIKELEARNPASVEVCTLFFKPGSYRKTLPIKYRAMEIGNEFIVGYGLDYDQLGRSLKDIYVVTE